MQEYGDSKRAQALWDVDSDDEEEDILEPNPKLSQGNNSWVRLWYEFTERSTLNTIISVQAMIFHGGTESSRLKWRALPLLTSTLTTPTRGPSLSSTKGERYQGTLSTPTWSMIWQCVPTQLCKLLTRIICWTLLLHIINSNCQVLSNQGNVDPLSVSPNPTDRPNRLHPPHVRLRHHHNHPRQL